MEEILPGDLDLAAISLLRLFQNTGVAEASITDILLACNASPGLYFSFLRTMKRISFALKIGFLNAENIEKPLAHWILSHRHLKLAQFMLCVAAPYARHVRFGVRVLFWLIVGNVLIG